MTIRSEGIWGGTDKHLPSPKRPSSARPLPTIPTQLHAAPPPSGTARIGTSSGGEVLENAQRWRPHSHERNTRRRRSVDPDMSDEQNKTNVVAFYDLMFNQNQPAAAIEQYAGGEYRQHNPHVGDGKQAFIDYFERMAAEHPGKRVEFKRVIADGEFVVLHCHQIWPDEEYAGIDIFRLDDDGKVVEHWDVLQTIPAASLNDNGMF